MVDAKAESLGTTTFVNAGSINMTDARVDTAKGTLANVTVGGVSLGDVKFDYTTPPGAQLPHLRSLQFVQPISRTQPRRSPLP